MLTSSHDTSRTPYPVTQRAATKPERPLPHVDPYLRPSIPFANRVARLAWRIVQALLFRPSPRPFHGWRSMLLRLFGATIGANCHIYPRARIWAPWNLSCEDVVAIADDAEIYNPARVTLGSHCTISQQAFICAATHDYDDPAFPMIWQPIHIGGYAWIGARGIVRMGVLVGEGAVLGLGSIATRDLEPWIVYAGIPARAIRKRTRCA
jgi:putative colanic acid biosynthesis acetyltransferase WcaF